MARTGREGFADAVEAVVRSLRAGEVASYGEVAAEAGYPGAARAVGGVLRSSEGLPWWRVVRADGTLAAPKAEDQAARLESEGIRVVAGRVARDTVTP